MDVDVVDDDVCCPYCDGLWWDRRFVYSIDCKSLHRIEMVFRMVSINIVVVVTVVDPVVVNDS